MKYKLWPEWNKRGEYRILLMSHDHAEFKYVFPCTIQRENTFRWICDKPTELGTYRAIGNITFEVMDTECFDPFEWICDIWERRYANELIKHTEYDNKEHK